ncbi:MAG: iron ABC transporter permease [Mesorhizobium sp.]|nr:iron ABC transporter permease [Mesorhizobium sp.]MBL8580374.1 iron ABC transporter permease [Mesorhizobium sp.]
MKYPVPRLLLGWLAVLVAAGLAPWYGAGPSGGLFALSISGFPPLLAVLSLVAAASFAAMAPGRGIPQIAFALGAIGVILFLPEIAGQTGGFRASEPLTSANQPPIGAGAVLTVIGLLGIIALGLMRRGLMGGESFGNHLLTFIVAVLFLFILMPLGEVFRTVLRADGELSVAASFMSRTTGSEIWSLACVSGSGRCGMAWNSIFLGAAVATSCTLLGLVAALYVTRTGLRRTGGVRLLSLLPLVTPPFVVGLALILLFGRSGTITVWAADLMGVRPSRWIYGPQGVWLAQTLGLAPLAFMVIHTVLLSVSPSVEEASSTLRASRWYTFRTVTLPLIRPGLAGAFLLSFIESMADLGNPLIIGGGFQVLATGIYFKIVGAQSDLGDAAGLGLVLLMISLMAFFAQSWFLKGASYVTVTGKGDSGRNALLPARVKFPVIVITIIWTLFIILIYGTVLVGGFAELWGRNYSPTLRHFEQAFGVTMGQYGIVWSGGAWNSFSTTLVIAGLAAPVTAALGLLTAWLIARCRFPGRVVFEFTAMLSFAMPGTVVGLAYVLAFNAPPIEMTGTAAILFFAFISRNMPVGVRVGLAQLSQIDRSLDEVSLTMGASQWMTVRRVLVPLLKPAIATAIIYAFVSAVTTLSQVIFLVSPRYDWATTYIVSLVENTNYGPAIAYSVVLIILLIAAIGLLQILLRQAVFRRRDTDAPLQPAVGEIR